MRITTISTSDNSVLISVVMSVHNFDRYPIPGIETTLEQTYTDFEFIVVDDTHHLTIE